MPKSADVTAAPRVSTKCLALAALLLGVSSAPAFADAITYTGTLGGRGIVLELTEPEDGPLLGRYSYQDRGADIPLHMVSVSEDETVLAEELPCTPALCVRADGDLVLDPPLGGRFQLHFSVDRTSLTGVWRAPGAADDEPVDLIRFGEREYDRDDVFPYGSFLWVNYGRAPITPVTSPYEYAKMQVDLIEGPLHTRNGAIYRDVTDPRVGFAFPRIVSLPGSGDIAGINAMLDQQRWAINFAGFECLGMAYRSGVWMPKPFGDADNPLDYISREQIAIDYLSDTIMTIRQSGSLSCGGQSPEAYVEYRTYDVREGTDLDPGEIFRDWDRADNQPTQKLIDWVVSAYRESPDYDTDRATWCLTDENMVDSLEIGFAEGDLAVFMLGYLEDATCMGPIVTVPLADVRELLTDKAVGYFPSLAAIDATPISR